MRRSDPSRIIIDKCWPPTFLLVVAFIFQRRGFHSGQLAFLLLALLLTVFHVTLAIVEVSNGTLRYRRFVRWTNVPLSEIPGCGLSKTGLTIGYIQFKHFLWPWGKLYFLLDDPGIKGTDILTLIGEGIQSEKTPYVE